MASIQWHIGSCLCVLAKKVELTLTIAGLTLRSLFYNEFADRYYVGDTCMEPMFWVVDHCTKILGPVCVVCVIILMSSIIAIAYIIGLPFYWQLGLAPTIFLLILGHWILINVLFNYYMAYMVLPGYPPQGALIPEAVTICKKCISPKPPRTHHCSVCNVCVLKMDHHCPWLNNCIGHFNHRYFFMFCIYSWIGNVFIIIFGLPIAWQHFATGIEPLNITQVAAPTVELHLDMSTVMDVSSTTLGEGVRMYKRTWPEAVYHSSIVYAGLLCIAVFVALGALLAWHSRLISKGETSIEGHINKRERQRLLAEERTFKSPYDFGPRTNWLLFLGIYNGRTIRHILLPSTHKPLGNGLQWHNQDSAKWPNDLRSPRLKNIVTKLDSEEALLSSL